MASCHEVGLCNGIHPQTVIMMTRSHPLATALVLSALLSPLSAQQDWVTWTTVDGGSPTDQFGTALTGLGDLNSDGYDDYAVTSIGADNAGQNTGMVTFFSGQDDSVLTVIDGLSGEQLGFSLAFLGEHNSDGLPKLAVGAPYASTANGPFSGLVRIYTWDDANSTANLFQELPGSTPGALFGISLAAFDDDGDGELDLAVGASGTNFQDGSVETFLVTDFGASASNTFFGASGSMEMFGWSVASAVLPSPGAGVGATYELVVGAPFADDTAVDAGAVILIESNGTQTTLFNPVGSVANAHLGWSVAGGMDARGNGIADVAAGAPDTTNGEVVLWDGASLGVAEVMLGAAPGVQFGYSVLLCPDTNFDGYADLAVGSPSALGGRGAANVYAVANAPSQVHSTTGQAGTDGNLGWSLGIIGDLNQTDKMEIGVSSPRFNGLVGRIEIMAPPAQDIGPIGLSLLGNFDWETDVQMRATNLSPGGGGNLFWYVGTNLSETTSPEGYDLNIGGLLTLISVDANPGDTAQQVYRVLDNIPDGTELFFQMVEDRNGFVRISNTESGEVNDPGVTLFVFGDTAGQPITMRTRWGIPNSPVYIYGTNQGFTQNPTNNVPNGSWQINLRNPRFLGQPGDKSGPLGAPDEGQYTSQNINIPSGFVGVTASFQAYDWDLFSPAMTPVVQVTFN